MRRKVKPKRAKQFKDEDDDRISRLPLHILQHILSLLPPKEAVLNSTLSRTWLHAWNSLPVSTLKFVCRAEQLEETFPLVSNFYDTLSVLHRKESIIVNLHVSWPHFRNDLYENCIDEWMRLVTKHRVKELEINVLPEKVKDNFSETLDGYTLPHETLFAAAESLVALLLRGCKVAMPSLRIENRNFVALRVLFWEDDFVNDQRVEELLPRCPNLEECILISVFKRASWLRLFNCRKLKQVRLDGFNNVIITNMPSLQVLDISNFRNIRGENCNAVRKMILNTGEDTSCGDVEYFVSRRPLLQSLVLNTNHIVSIGIASHSLETFSFSSGTWLHRVEICAPRLRCYEHRGIMLPEILIEKGTLIETSPFVSRRIELVLTPQRHGDTYLFFKCLRRNLAKLTECSYILKLIIDAREFAPLPLPSIERCLPPAAVIDSVELKYIWSPLVYSFLIKWVLWCCRPLSLSVYPSCIFFKAFQDIVLRRLDDTKHCGERCTCTSHLADVKVDTRYGRKDLKNFKIDDFYQLQLEGILKFRLEWHL